MTHTTHSGDIHPAFLVHALSSSEGHIRGMLTVYVSCYAGDRKQVQNLARLGIVVTNGIFDGFLLDLKCVLPIQRLDPARNFMESSLKKRIAWASTQ
jgi:hypothetical protein